MPVEYAVEALTGVVRVSEGGLVESPWFLYIQDCSLVGPMFWSKACALYARIIAHHTSPPPGGAAPGTATHAAALESVPLNPKPLDKPLDEPLDKPLDEPLDEPLDVVKLLDAFSLSVGMYRTAWVESIKDKLLPLRIFDADTDAIKKIKETIEDAAFNLASPDRTLCLGRFDNELDRKVVGKCTYPGSTTQRLVEHYPSLDYFKLKSWWGQSWETNDKGDTTPIIPVGV